MVNSSGSCPENRCSIQRPAIDFGFTFKVLTFIRGKNEVFLKRHSMYVCFLPTSSNSNGTENGVIGSIHALGA